jgi:hypothetical protein
MDRECVNPGFIPPQQRRKRSAIDRRLEARVFGGGGVDETDGSSAVWARDGEGEKVAPRLPLQPGVGVAKELRGGDARHSSRADDTLSKRGGSRKHVRQT